MSGWLWTLATIIGPSILGGLMVYGIVVTRRRRRDAAAQHRTEVATKQLYQAEQQQDG